MSAFNPDDILTISTASYDHRKFTVVESNGHRTVMIGTRGARRVLVETVGVPERLSNGTILSGETYSIHEDDGEKNRGRPCTVDHVEPAVIELPAGQALTGAQPPDYPPTWLRARYELGRALGLPAETVWAVCLHEAELMRKAATLARHRPITAMELAMLMKCETAKDVAEWVIERDITHACVTHDQHASDNGAAMKLYLSSLEIRKASAEAGTSEREDG